MAWRASDGKLSGHSPPQCVQGRARHFCLRMSQCRPASCQVSDHLLFRCSWWTAIEYKLLSRPLASRLHSVFLIIIKNVGVGSGVAHVLCAIISSTFWLLWPVHSTPEDGFPVFARRSKYALMRMRTRTEGWL